MPRVIEVIESQTVRGKGVEGDPIRTVVQYHTKDGELLAERDSLQAAAANTAEQGSRK